MSQPITQENIRNIAIIAHVDHGKTTLVDAMLKQTQTFASHEKEMDQTTILDSNELERERGVTILAKNTAVFWNEFKINILDTPGHADFSGEVERVLNMADGCVLLVDAAEGVLSQTQFVLRLALGLGLTPIVIINKVDRKDQRTEAVEAEIADLFLELATDESQLDFPVLYARGIDGVAGFETEEEADHALKITDSDDLSPLFETVTKHFPAPSGDPEKPLQVQITSLDSDPHLGTIAIGRITNGRITAGDKVLVMPQEHGLDDDEQENYTVRIEQIFVQRGLHRDAVAEASAGEIVAVTGIKKPKIGDTIADIENPVAMPEIAISEPTVKIRMSVNDSPFAGDADYTTSRQLRERLEKELQTNVGLRMEEGETGDSMVLVGRGELHLAILIETMRRESYEFSLARPEVVIKEIDGKKHEPWEEVQIEAPEDYTGYITQSMGKRKGQLQHMEQSQDGMRFTFEIATANLIGYRHDLVTQTSGTAMLSSQFLEFRPMSTRADQVRNGALISHETGTATVYGLEKAQQRAKMLVNPGEDVYGGQVVGINSRRDDMAMNVTKGKKLTNMRASGSDDTVSLAPAWKPSLEQFLTLIAEDEMLEVTPSELRLRKKNLNGKW